MLCLCSGVESGSTLIVMYRIDETKNCNWELTIVPVLSHQSKVFEKKEFRLRPGPETLVSTDQGRLYHEIEIPLNLEWIYGPVCSVMVFRLELIRTSTVTETIDVVDHRRLYIQMHYQHVVDADMQEDMDVALLPKEAKDQVDSFLVMSGKLYEFFEKGMLVNSKAQERERGEKSNEE